MRFAYPSLALLAAAAIAAAPGSARASLDVVTISGIWSATAPVSLESAPGAAFSASFVVATPNKVSAVQVADAAFSLNGVKDIDPPIQIYLQDAANGGLFDLRFNSDNYIEAFGADVGSDGSLASGVYAAQFAMVVSPFPLVAASAVLSSVDANDAASDVVIDGSGTVIIAPYQVPEPSSVAAAAAWLLGIALAIRMRGRRKPRQAGAIRRIARRTRKPIERTV